MSEILAGDVAFLLCQLSVDDYFDDDTFDAVVNDDSGRCEINIQDLAESAARHIGKLEAENAALKEENERLKERYESADSGQEYYSNLCGLQRNRLNQFYSEVKALKAQVAELESAARLLRTCQQAYMLDRGNDELGKAVGEAAIRLDEILKEPANEGGRDAS